MNSEQPLRIVLVTGGVKLGGAVTFLCNLGGELVRRQFPVILVSFEKENPLAADFERQRIPVVALDDRRLIYEDRMQMALKALKNFKPTVVLSNLASPSFEILRYLPTGIFRLGVGHSDDPPIYPGIAKYAQQLDMVAVVSSHMQEKMERQPALAQIPVRYLPLGVPIPEQFQNRRNSNSPLRIIYLGRLDHEQKRVRLFPQIFEELKSSGIPFHWTIAGDGPDKNFLRQTMKSNIPSQTVSFTGNVPYARVPETLREHDIFLLVSDFEGLPLSLLEAMGSGLVPVISNLPSGIPEVVDSSNGILVPVNDTAGYARSIVHLHHNRAELAQKSDAARKRVKSEFSITAMADRWLGAMPKQIPQIGEWPSRWKIQAPLGAPNPFYFSPILRPFRRLLMRLIR